MEEEKRSTINTTNINQNETELRHSKKRRRRESYNLNKAEKQVFLTVFNLRAAQNSYSRF